MGRQFLDAIIAQIVAESSRVRAGTDAGASAEKVGVCDILNRIASSDIFSASDVPPFDHAIMDGYAVVASDTFYTDETNPTSLIIKGYLSAGESSPSEDGMNTCSPI